MRRGSIVLLVAPALLLFACGDRASAPEAHSALPPGVRRIGAEPRFHPPVARGRMPACRPGLGRRFAAHVEVFAEDRVVLVAAGIGARPPIRFVAGRIAHARCFGRLVTIDPTGLVLVRQGVAATLGDLFDAWGQSLTAGRVARFSGPVRVYVGGRRRRGAVRAVPLTRHAEIVVEVGPYVPPHAAYAFPDPY